MTSENGGTGMFIWKKNRHSRNKDRHGGRHPAVIFSAVILSALVTWGAVCSPAAQAADMTLQSGTIVCPSAGANTTLPPALTGTSALSAILIEASTGDAVFAQNAEARLPMASTTKIMTALVALESCPLDDTVTVPPEAVGVEGSSIYLTEGERLSFEDLLYALLLESANDAAVAIAVHAAGSVEDFVARMNEKALALGLEDTHFANPHGLDDDAHYTTARELSLIARAAMENPDFRTITATTKRVIPLQGDAGARLLINHNKMLWQYDGAIGGKTGFTKTSGRCLLSVAERGGVTLIAVTLKAPDDWRDHTAMLDYGFSVYESATLCEAEAYNAPLSLQSGTQTYVTVTNKAAVTLPLRRDHGDIVCTVELPHLAFAPVTAGQTVGRLVFTEISPDGGRRVLAETPLTARYDVEATPRRRSLWTWLRELFGL